MRSLGHGAFKRNVRITAIPFLPYVIWSVSVTLCHVVLAGDTCLRSKRFDFSILSLQFTRFPLPLVPRKRRTKFPDVLYTRSHNSCSNSVRRFSRTLSPTYYAYVRTRPAVAPPFSRASRHCVPLNASTRVDRRARRSPGHTRTDGRPVSVFDFRNNYHVCINYSV